MGYTRFWENLKLIVEIKAQWGLQKYKRMYPLGWSSRTEVVSDNVCHFGDPDLGVEKEGRIE